MKKKTIFKESAASDAEHDLRDLIRNDERNMQMATGLMERGYAAAKDRTKLLQTEDPAVFFVYSIKHDISALHRKELGKYVYGVGRMVLGGAIRTSRDILHLNQVLEMLAESPELRNQYNRDFNGKDLPELFEELQEAMDSYNKKMKDESGEDYVRNEKYMFEKVNDFGELQPLSEYCDWCIVHSEDAYDQYITDHNNIMFLIYDTNFMSYEKDDPEYKDSLISVIVDSDLNLVCSTSRLNHDIKSGDRTYSYKQLSQIIGANIVKEMQKQLQ